MPTPHKHAEIIKAWADGIEIQMKYEDGSWRDLTRNYPTWEAIDYRIKPEPTVIEGYCWESMAENCHIFANHTRVGVTPKKATLIIHPD